MALYTWAIYRRYDSHDERCWLLSLLPYFLWRPKRLPSAPMHWSWRQQGRASKWNFSATSLRNCSFIRSKSNRKKIVTAASRDVIPVMYSLRFFVFLYKSEHDLKNTRWMNLSRGHFGWHGENVHDFSFTDNGPWSSIHQYGFIKFYKVYACIYCWQKKSCTSWYGKYPIICRVLYIPGGAGFLPSTVSQGIPWTKNCPFPLKVMTWITILTHPAHGLMQGISDPNCSWCQRLM